MLELSRWEIWGLEKFTSLPEVTQVENGKVGTQSWDLYHHFLNSQIGKAYFTLLFTFLKRKPDIFIVIHHAEETFSVSIKMT